MIVGFWVAIGVGVGVFLTLPDNPAVQTSHHAAALKNPRSDLAPSPNFPDTCSSQLDSSPACLSAVINATNRARSLEGVRTLSFSAASFRKLTVAKQLFVLVDLERTARGIAPFTVLSNQLDQIALSAAQAETDPRMGTNAILAGSGPIVGWGGNWGGSTSSAAASNYYWMYDDGEGAINATCTPSSRAQCWGHRDNILGSFALPGACTGRPVMLAMGAAESPGRGAVARASFTELLSASCGPSPTSVAMTWTQAQHLIDK